MFQLYFGINGGSSSPEKNNINFTALAKAKWSITFYFFTKFFGIAFYFLLSPLSIEITKRTYIIAVWCVNIQRELSGNICFLDRKSTRLNSSHANISYAVFCLKKKKEK